MYNYASMILIAAAVCLAGCGSDTTTQSDDCNTILSASDSSFKKVATLFNNSGRKSCDSCHNTQEPIKGYNFETSAAIFNELTTKYASVYHSVVTGKMPEHGTRWNADDLNILRSWRCNGSQYEP